MGFLTHGDMLETRRRWWDTLSANDGGVVHDASIRQWTLDAAGRSAGTLAEILQQGVRQRNWERGVLCITRNGYGSIPINTIFSGMNIHKSQLF